MRILITGADGMLGRDVCKFFKEEHSIIGFDIRLNPQDNITHKEYLWTFLKEKKIEYILHLAAKTDVDDCERFPDDAFLNNTIGTKNLALYCFENDIPMVYISTGSVFDGLKPEPYIEYDVPNPQSFYAKSKYQGEQIVSHFVKKSFIFRAGWMFGGAKEDKKFVFKIIELAKKNNEIKAVIDKIGTPTYTKDFAKGIFQMIKTRDYGLYHMGNLGFCSRYELACKIMEYAQLPVKVISVSSALFPLAAPRPRMEAIRNYNFEIMNKLKMRPWEISLKEYIHELME